MPYRIATALAATALIAAPAAAQTVLSSELQDLNGATVTTTTDGTGKRTTSTGTRVSGAPTAGKWYQANVGGGGTVGITTDKPRNGNGSAFFATTSVNSKADMQYNFGGLTALSSYSAIGYDVFRDAASTTDAGLVPVFRLNIVKQTGSSFVNAGSLVFEFVYQNQTNPTAGVWNRLSATQTSGKWWATNAALGPTFAAADGGQKSLAEWISGNGGMLWVSGYNIGVGSGWAGTSSGAIDDIRLTSGRGTEAFNFEAVAAAVPEPSTWALLILGFGLTGAAMRRRRTSVAFA